MIGGRQRTLCSHLCRAAKVECSLVYYSGVNEFIQSCQSSLFPKWQIKWQMSVLAVQESLIIIAWSVVPEVALGGFLITRVP